jgi:3-keto-5-aminohexanoate cleavage enzyme
MIDLIRTTCSALLRAKEPGPAQSESSSPTRTFPPNTVAIDFLRTGLRRIVERGIPFEMEIADVGFLANAARLADEGAFRKDDNNYFLDYLFGFGGMPPTAQHLAFVQREGERLFPKARWGVLATGVDQFRMAAIGICMNCDVIRVGFEDNIYLPNGESAERNVDLVESMTRIIRDLGRDVANVDEAKVILGVASV